MNSEDALTPLKSTVYAFDEFRLEAENLLLTKNSEVVPLAPKACEVLVALVSAGGRLVNKQEILDKVWADAFVEEANLTHHISALRKALGEGKNDKKFIETIPRRGYRFVAPVSQPDENAAHVTVSERITTRAIERIEVETEETEKPEITSRRAFPPTAPTAPPKRNFLKIFGAAAVGVLIFALSFFAYRQWRQNSEMRSFESLRSVKLTAWKSSGSNDFWDFKSSHNGNMIAFSSTKDDNSAIYVKQVKGGEDIRITKDEWNNSSPLWSPDDQQIMFASVRERQAGIYFCPSLGGAATLLKIIGEGNLSLRNWSKDGSKIFYEFNGNFFRLNVNSKETAPLTDFPPDNKVQRYFRISPNEDKIAYRELTDDRVDLWIREIADGGKRRLTDDAEIETENDWNSDGSGLFYQINHQDIYQIFFIHADGRDPVQVTRGDTNLELIDVSPDGAKLFYYTSEDKSDIAGLNVETGEQSEIANRPESEFWADAAPDGKSVSYLSNPHQYAIQRLPDSNINVRSGADGDPLSFKGANQRWLPDGQRIAFLRYDEAAKIYNLWTFRTIDGEEKQITTAGVAAPGTASLPYNRTQTRDFNWSNDSRKVVYVGAKRQNIFLDTPEAETLNLTGNENPNRTFYCPLWSRGGDKIAYVSALKAASPNEKPQTGVWVFADGAAREIYTTVESLRFLGWTETGDEMLFEAASGALKAEPIDVKILQISLAGTEKTVNSFERISAFSAALSPDAKSIVFTKATGGKDDLYLARIGKNDIKKLTDNNDSHVFFGSPTWLPDNKTVYFDKQERINTISMFENLR